jgi:hypothetical protein
MAKGRDKQGREKKKKKKAKGSGAATQEVEFRHHSVVVNQPEAQTRVGE